VIRRSFVLGLAALALASAARAQSSATRTQIDLALAYASLRALEVRYGDGHVEVRAAEARLDTLSQSLEDARAHAEPIDDTEVARTLTAEIADVRARIAERSTRCGAGHPDMQTAVAREAALTEALAHVTSEGFFAPSRAHASPRG